MTETIPPHAQFDAELSRKTQKKWDIYLFGVAAASIAALFPLLSQRSEPGSALLLGYSAPKLAMIAIVAAGLVFAIAAAVFTRKPQNFKSNAARTSLNFTGILREFTTLLFFLTAGTLTIFIYWLPDAAPMLTLRFLPLGFWFAFLSLWSTLFLRLPSPFRLQRKQLLLALAGFALIVLLSVLGIPAFLRTRFGFKPDPFDFQPPGIALDWGQVVSALLAAAIISWIFSLLSWAVTRSNGPSEYGRGSKFAAFLLIWLLAALVWISVPTNEVLQHSYFMETAEPSGLPYPASDAAYFAVWAESMSMGLGMKSAVISRQLFVWLLSVFFRLSGNDFIRSIDFLTGFLALIPALGFLMTVQLTPKRRMGFFAGVFVGALLLLREWKTMYMAPHFGVSSSKMFLSDLPMLWMFLAVLNSAIWAYRKSGSSVSIRSPFTSHWTIVGAVFALAALVRSQVLVILPVLMLAILLRRKPENRAKILTWIGLCGAIVLVLAPALIRSRVITGTFALEDTSIHGFELPRRFSGDPNYEPTRIKGESDEEFMDRMSAELIRFATSRPRETVSFILNHWTKALSESMLVLPLGIDPKLTWRERTSPSYQDIARRMNDTPAGVFYPLIAVAFLGIAVSWKRGGWIIGTSCALYLLSSAFGRYSGWRFNLPADWFMVVYVGLGISALGEYFRALIVESGVSADKPESPMRNQSAQNLPNSNLSPVVVIIALVFAVILGAQPSLSEKLVPDEIQPSVENAAGTRAFLTEAKIDEQKRVEIAALISESEAFCSGIVLYPRYFYADEGLTSANPWAAYRPRDFDRLSFILLNRQNCDAVLPVEMNDALIQHHDECLIGGHRDSFGVLIGNFAICQDGKMIRSNLSD